MPKYSIVVPFHNEEENVTALYDRLKAVMEQVGESFELIFVDDGSSDRTYKLLEEIAKPHAVDGVQLQTGCAIGISLYPQDASDASTLMRLADGAMYQVRNSVGSGYQFARPGTNATPSRSPDPPPLYGMA